MPQTIVGRGAQIEFEILLIGNGVRYVDSLIKALEQMECFGLGAYRYPFRLSQIIHSKEQRIIWRNGKCLLHSMKSVAMPCFELPDVTRALIKIRTPLRIRHGGKILKTISFQTLIRNITNRIMTLTERYGAGQTERKPEKSRCFQQKWKPFGKNCIWYIWKGIQIGQMERWISAV